MIREYRFKEFIEHRDLAVKDFYKKEEMEISVKESVIPDTLLLCIYNNKGVCLYEFLISKETWQRMHRITNDYSAYGDRFEWKGNLPEQI